jgi:hypothetical protein
VNDCRGATSRAERRLGAFGTGLPPGVAVALSDRPVVNDTRAHDSTGLMSRQSLTAAGVRERLADPHPRTARGVEPAMGAITSCRLPGIPGAGFVLAQEFEGVMT